jgi:hypothetical protein
MDYALQPRNGDVGGANRWRRSSLKTYSERATKSLSLLSKPIATRREPITPAASQSRGVIEIGRRSARRKR